MATTTASVSSITKRSTNANSRCIEFNIDKKFQTKEGAPRSIYWAMSLKLPQNGDAFHTLNLGRIDVKLTKLLEEETKELAKTTREKRSVHRVWSCLLQHEPRMQHVPFAPFLCVAAARGFPTNPLCCFETVMFFLLNLCAEWMSSFPSPPMETLKILDTFFRSRRSTKSQQLWTHLNERIYQCNLLDYLWLPMQTFYLFSFSNTEWMKIFDDVVTRSDGMQFFYSIGIAFLETLHDKLMNCHTREAVIKTVTTPLDDAKVIEVLCATARSFCLHVPLPMRPIAEITTSPDSSYYYTMLTVGLPPPPPKKVDRVEFLNEINDKEEELLRRMANDENSLRVCSEIARFHRAVNTSLLAFDGGVAASSSSCGGLPVGAEDEALMKRVMRSSAAAAAATTTVPPGGEADPHNDDVIGEAKRARRMNMTTQILQETDANVHRLRGGDKNSGVKMNLPEETTNSKVPPNRQVSSSSSHPLQCSPVLRNNSQHMSVTTFSSAEQSSSAASRSPNSVGSSHVDGASSPARSPSQRQSVENQSNNSTSSPQAKRSFTPPTNVAQQRQAGAEGGALPTYVKKAAAMLIASEILNNHKARSEEQQRSPARSSTSPNNVVLGVGSPAAVSTPPRRSNGNVPVHQDPQNGDEEVEPWSALSPMREMEDQQQLQHSPTYVSSPSPRKDTTSNQQTTTQKQTVDEEEERELTPEDLKAELLAQQKQHQQHQNATTTTTGSLAEQEGVTDMPIPYPPAPTKEVESSNPLQSPHQQPVPPLNFAAAHAHNVSRSSRASAGVETVDTFGPSNPTDEAASSVAIGGGSQYGNSARRPPSSSGGSRFSGTY